MAAGRPLARTWSLLSAAAPAASARISLLHDVLAMGWRVRDRILIAPTTRGPCDAVRISAASTPRAHGSAKSSAPSRAVAYSCVPRVRRAPSSSTGVLWQAHKALPAPSTSVQSKARRSSSAMPTAPPRSRTSRSARRPSGRRARGSHSWPRRCADVHAACTQLERYAWALRQ